jgi:hypothetical protein
MKPPVKIAAFVVGLVVVFGAAFGCGTVMSNGNKHASVTGGHGGHDAAAPMHGMGAEDQGYRMVADETTFTTSRAAPFSFRIVDPKGVTVTGFDQLHERELHLIVVRRDLNGFQHVHPKKADDGTWTTELALPSAGTWRAFADIDPAGATGQVTVAADLTVEGEDTLLAPAHVPATDFDVSFDRDGSRIEVTVERGGATITPEPYLGARGHLVAIRRSDLAYAHVHPEEADESTVPFEAELPAGAYRLFFDFKVDGTVRTATTEVTVS